MSPVEPFSSEQRGRRFERVKGDKFWTWKRRDERGRWDRVAYVSIASPSIAAESSMDIIHLGSAMHVRRICFIGTSIRG